MAETWYGVVAANTSLTQGDLVSNCPLIGWKSGPVAVEGNKLEDEVLKQATDAFSADVVVMTQACDLENDKVDNVVVCPHISLADFKKGVGRSV